MSDIITIKNLSCAYGKSKVLNDISFCVEPQSIVFIMGNNGAGKTTLLNCLLNNIKATRGEIWYNGELLENISKEKLARTVSYVPQNVNINCDFKVKDYLILGRNPYISLGNPKDSDYEIVEKYAVKTGIIGIIEKPFNTLSGGQKQWVAITRALVQETPILIMDEPMSALDIGKQADLLMLLKELASDGKTIILTSHNPNHCFYLKDSKVCLINDNAILSYSSAETAFSLKNIKAVYGEHVFLSEDKTNICFKV